MKWIGRQFLEMKTGKWISSQKKKIKVSNNLIVFLYIFVLLFTFHWLCLDSWHISTWLCAANAMEPRLQILIVTSDNRRTSILLPLLLLLPLWQNDKLNKWLFLSLLLCTYNHPMDEIWRRRKKSSLGRRSKENYRNEMLHISQLFIK